MVCEVTRYDRRKEEVLQAKEKDLERQKDQEVGRRTFATAPPVKNPFVKPHEKTVPPGERRQLDQPNGINETKNNQSSKKKTSWV